jgi:hypothetical protein
MRLMTISSPTGRKMTYATMSNLSIDCDSPPAGTIAFEMMRPGAPELDLNFELKMRVFLLSPNPKSKIRNPKWPNATALSPPATQPSSLNYHSYASPTTTPENAASRSGVAIVT